MTTADRESAADFPPSPGEVQPATRRLRVEFAGEVIAETNARRPNRRKRHARPSTTSLLKM